jgi:hypothetical protein
MADTIRIRTTPNGEDKYIKINVEQKFDFIEVLSLKLSQEDAYRKFCSDYGVIVGRVPLIMVLVYLMLWLVFYSVR